MILKHGKTLTYFAQKDSWMTTQTENSILDLTLCSSPSLEADEDVLENALLSAICFLLLQDYFRRHEGTVLFWMELKPEMHIWMVTWTMPECLLQNHKKLAWTKFDLFFRGRTFL